MPLRKSSLRFIIIVFTIAALVFFGYQQYRSYRTDIKITKQQLLLTSLRGQLANYVESLNMSARLYVLTGDTAWKQRYNRHLLRYDSSLLQIKQLLPDNFPGRLELDSAGFYMFQIDAFAFKLVHSNQDAQAKLMLFGNGYQQQRRNFRTGLAKLETQIDTETEEFMQFHRSEAIKNAIALGTVIVFILIAWMAFLEVSRKWQQQIDEANRRRLEEALIAEQVLQKANKRLHLLSAHLQKMREKEKLALTNDIHEELSQQLATIKMQTDHISAELESTQPNEAGSLKEVSARLKNSISFLTNLATNVYPLVLRDFGLLEALEFESKRVADNFNIDVIFYSTVEDVNLDEWTATSIYRVFQEKLHAVVVASATEVVTNLFIEHGNIVLSIFYNLSFNSNDPELNIIEDVAIEERVRNIKGRMKTQPTENGNCVTSITVPYWKQDEGTSFLSENGVLTQF